MDLYTFAASILSLAILIAYLNHRFIKMQTTIAITCASVLISLIIILIGKIGYDHFSLDVIQSVRQINFSSLLLNGMLSFLLFAGALTVDLDALKNQKWEIGVLSSFSTILSGVLVGVLSYYLLHFLGFDIAFIYCLLFGALISPTDPIAVLATFKQLKAPKDLDVIVAGESLFNDGVGIVMFLTLFQLAFSHVDITAKSVTLLFLRQAIGGMVYGGILGFLTSWLIYYADDHKIEILLTIGIATGGYALAQAIGISGPLAMVVAGFIMGNYARHHCMSRHTPVILDEFWEIIDEVLNAVLFLIIGFELLLIGLSKNLIIAAFLAIPLVLFVRLITVAIPMSLFRFKKNYSPYITTILVWGGLRGALAIALVLTLPPGMPHDLLLAMTYVVVAFAVIVQGLSIAPLVRLSVAGQRNSSVPN